MDVTFQPPPYGKFISRNELISVMAEEDLTVPSTFVPFIKAQQTGHASRYHTFEFVSVTYIHKGKVLPEPKQSNVKLMVGWHLKDSMNSV